MNKNILKCYENEPPGKYGYSRSELNVPFGVEELLLPVIWLVLMQCGTDANCGMVWDVQI